MMQNPLIQWYPNKTRMFSLAFVYGIAGPPLGWLCVLVAMSMRELWQGNPLIDSNVLSLLLVGTFFSYIFGLIPAAACGVLMGLFRTHKRWSSALLSALLGCVPAGLVMLFFMRKDPFGIVYMGMMPGAFAGAVLGAWLYTLDDEAPVQPSAQEVASTEQTTSAQ